MAVDGRMMIHGIYNRITTKGLPVVMPAATLVYEVIEPKEGANLELEVVHVASGQSVVKHVQPVRLNVGSDRINNILQVVGLTLPLVGKYRAELLVDGTQIGETILDVVEA